VSVLELLLTGSDSPRYLCYSCTGKQHAKNVLREGFTICNFKKGCKRSDPGLLAGSSACLEGINLGIKSTLGHGHSSRHCLRVDDLYLRGCIQKFPD
jgi:hypothetical protein